MKLATVLLALFVMMAATQAHYFRTFDLTAASLEHPLFVPLGAPVKIIIESNPSTGYDWYILNDMHGKMEVSKTT